MVVLPTMPETPKQIPREIETTAGGAVSSRRNADAEAVASSETEREKFSRLLEKYLSDGESARNTAVSSGSSESGATAEKTRKSSSGREPERDGKSDVLEAVSAGLVAKPDEKPAAVPMKNAGKTSAERDGAVRSSESGLSRSIAESKKKTETVDGDAAKADRKSEKGTETGAESRSAFQNVTAEFQTVSTADREPSASAEGTEVKISRRDMPGKSARAAEDLRVAPAVRTIEAGTVSAAQAASNAAESESVKTSARQTKTESAEGRKKASASEKPGSAKDGTGEEGVKLDLLDRRSETPDPVPGSKAAGENGGTISGEAGTDAFGTSPETRGTASGGASDASNFQSVFRDRSEALERYLNAEGNEGIARNARIVLRDGDQGEIRLRLKPEHLGTVRISLTMEEDRIAGRIIVENETVREAFEKNLHSLADAFFAEGFQTGNLEVTVGNDRRDGGQRRQETGRSLAVAVKELERHAAPAEYAHDGYLNLIV